MSPVKTNHNGKGTCAVKDVADPTTGQKDGIKDLKCQFTTGDCRLAHTSPSCPGSSVDPLDPEHANSIRAFSARQEITILP